MITLPIKIFLYVLSFIDDNFMPIMSFIKDKIGISNTRFVHICYLISGEEFKKATS